jgi:hypothetical protein
MKSKTGNHLLLKRALTATLSAVGLKETDVKFNGARIDIASCGVVVAPALVDGKRVWKADHSFSLMGMEDAFERPVTTQLFTVPLEDDLLLARRLATHVATTRIDAAIDAILVG